MAASAVAERTDLVVTRRPRASLRWAIAAVGCAAAGAVFVISYGLDEPAPEVDAVLVTWITLSYVFCGLIAWSRRPESRFGPLMIAAAFGPLLSRLSEIDASLPQTIGEPCRLLPIVLFLHVFLAYPSGRLERGFEQVLVAAGYAAVIGSGLAAMMLGLTGHKSLIEVVDRPGAAGALLGIGRIGTASIALTGLVVLFVRARSLRRPVRRSLVRACFALALVSLAAGLLVRHFDWPAATPIKWVGFTLIGVAPLLFLVGFLRARLARSAAADLFVELRGNPSPVDLRAALARALRDPSLQLVYWLPEFGSYADVDGREVDLRDLEAGRAVTLIDNEGGAHVAALIHEPTLKDEPELLGAVTAAAAISLENARLHAELRARLEELKGSRARIVDAGQKERQRLERNLHDGAQQRLVALSLELGLLEERLAGDPEASVRLDQARHEIATSLDELRDVARGIHPAVVTGHGLEIALEQLAVRAPVPVRLEVKIEGRLPERLEVAAFYLVSESLANIGKHSNATSATVEVARTNAQLMVEIVDNGVGGADTERGSGLRGLADRVEALEGRLRVWSPSGGGTRLRAEIPCAS